MKTQTILIFSLALLLSGCSSLSQKSKSITSTYNSIYADLGGKEQRAFLVFTNEYGKKTVIGQTRNTTDLTEEHKILQEQGPVFLLPGEDDEKYHLLKYSGKMGCMKLHIKGTIFDYESQCISLEPFLEYSNTVEKRNKKNSEVAGYQSEMKVQRSELDALQKTISEIRSYQNGKCKLLAREPFPPRPATVCDTEQKLERARIACLAPLGSMACSMMLEEAKKKQGQKARKIEKFLAGGTCSAALKGNVDGEDIALSIMEGVGDWASESNMDIISGFGQLVSGISKAAKLTKTYGCLVGLEGSCERKLSNWEAVKKEIREFPEKNLKACDKVTAQKIANRAKQMRIERQLNLVKEELTLLEEELIKIEKKQVQMPL